MNLSHVRALFATRKLAYSTSLIMLVWAFIGLGYPLYNAFIPYIQATSGAKFGDGSTYLTYRNSLIIASLGVPGAILGGALVEVPNFGRRGTLAVSTVLTGVFLYASTTALSSAALLGWQCAFNFFSNIMYAQSSTNLLNFTALHTVADSRQVRRPLRIYAGDFPYKRPWNRQRVDCDREQDIWHHGGKVSRLMQSISC